MVIEMETIPEATPEEALAALDYTSQYYLGMPATDFMDKVTAGEILPSDPISGLSHVFAMLDLVRQ
jgi:hypothetical protein